MRPAIELLTVQAFSQADKQRIAAAAGCSETAFVLGSIRASVRLEFFTPTRQIADSGHATVAAFSALRARGMIGDGDASKEILDGVRAVRVAPDAIYLQQAAPVFSPPLDTGDRRTCLPPHAERCCSQRLAARRPAVMVPTVSPGERVMDSYVRKVLTDGEHVLHTGQVSWWTLSGSVALALALLAAAVAWQWLRPTPILPLLLLVAAAVIALVAYVKQRSTELAITNKRLIVKRGFLRRDTIEINLIKVESLQVEQPLLGRLLNYGDIIVSAGGGPMAPITGIARPLDFRRHFNEATDRMQQPAQRPS